MPGFGAFGPYRHHQRWRVLYRPRDGEAGHRSFATEAAAKEYQLAADAEIRAQGHARRTVDEAIAAYGKYLDAKGNRASSVKLTPHRLRVFFGEDVGEPLGDLTAARGRALYERLTTATYQRGKEARCYSVDTCRNTLAEARTFLGWCVSSKWLRSNVLDGVKGIGKRKHGKPQLTIDEARAWAKVALALAPKEPGAIAALLAVTLGFRASEIVERRVRDLDDGGRLLRVTKSKTDAGVRVVEVPELLRAHLVALARGRESGELLFGKHWRDWPRGWVEKICEAAKVPRVSAQAMRGLHASLAVQAGATAHLVAATLGHESASTTLQSYATAGSVEHAKRRAALKVLDGGVPGGVTAGGGRPRTR